MIITQDAYIIEWEDDKYVVVTTNCQEESTTTYFLALDGSDFIVMELIYLSLGFPLFDSISDAENAWNEYKNKKTQYLTMANKRKAILKRLN